MIQVRTQRRLNNFHFIAIFLCFLVAIVFVVNNNNNDELLPIGMLVLGFSLDTTTPYHLGLSSMHQRQQLARTIASLLSVAVPVGDDDVLASHDDDNDNNNNNNKNSNSSLFHTVQGVVCREVTNELPVIGTVTVLEATADSQEDLVNECLELEEEEEQQQLEFEIGVDVGVVKEKKQKRIAQGDPYGSVLWPAAWAVSNYMLSQPDLRDNLNSLSILELGTGTGLVSISVAMGGAKRVIATDYEPLALALIRYAADNINSSSSSKIETQLLDLCDLEQQPLPIQGIDIVCAADIMYEPKTGVAMAHRAVEALRNNCRVIVGDSPGRAGRPAFLNTLKELGVKGAEFQETIGKTCSGPRNDLICGKGSTSVSDTPQELSVALLDLKPNMLKG